MSLDAGSDVSFSAKSWEQRVEALESVPTVPRVDRALRDVALLA